GGQHGDDKIRTHDRGVGVAGGGAAGLRGSDQGLLGEVEGGDGKTFAGKIGGHGATHIAEADKCDLVGHGGAPQSVFCFTFHVSRCTLHVGATCDNGAVTRRLGADRSAVGGVAAFTCNVQLNNRPGTYKSASGWG